MNRECENKPASAFTNENMAETGDGPCEDEGQIADWAGAVDLGDVGGG